MFAMTTIQITLPDQLAQEARRAGLLTTEALERLLREAIDRQQAVEELFAARDRMAAAKLPPMTMEEIQAEVDAVRAERRAQRDRDRAASRHFC